MEAHETTTRAEPVEGPADEWYHRLVDAVHDAAIVGLDPEGRVISWNAGAESITGHRAGETLGRSLALIYTCEDAEHGEPERDLLQAEADGRLEAEGWRARKDGTRFWASVALTALYDDDHGLLGFSALIRDLTERRESEESQRKAARDLAVANSVLRRQATELIRSADAANQAAFDAQAASRAKSAFLATMSHELRTPMNGLIGMTELLLGTELDDDQREFAQTVDGCAQSLLGVISDVLDFSRIEAGQMELEIAEVPLRLALEESVSLVSVGAHTKGLQIAVDLAPDGPASVVADAVRLRQILLNLLGNAIKFTPEGSVVVRAAPDGAGVRIEVADTGIGIAAEDQSRLFGSFSQLDASTTREYGGSGLGLAIAKQLAEVMGGAIGVESAPGSGSTFWFTLPAG
jgi:two-component system sensor histidine kinase/response regulator